MRRNRPNRPTETAAGAEGRLPDHGVPSLSVSRATACRIAREKPELLVAPGGMVYPTGWANQCMHFFWKTYDVVDAAGPKTGAP